MEVIAIIIIIVIMIIIIIIIFSGGDYYHHHSHSNTRVPLACSLVLEGKKRNFFVVKTF